MIDTFKKGIYHTYSFDNENTIKMNDSMMHIFSLCNGSSSNLVVNSLSLYFQVNNYPFLFAFIN